MCILQLTVLTVAKVKMRQHTKSSRILVCLFLDFLSIAIEQKKIGIDDENK